MAELTRTTQFIPIELLKPIPDPEKLTTEEEIELQVQEALISIPGFNGYDIDEERPQFVVGGVEKVNVDDVDDAIDPRLLHGPGWEVATQQDYISLDNTWEKDSIKQMMVFLLLQIVAVLFYNYFHSCRNTYCEFAYLKGCTLLAGAHCLRRPLGRAGTRRLHGPV